MTKIPGSRKRQIAFFLCVLVWTFFIWYNSMCPATVSSIQSGRIEQVLSPFLNFLCVPETVRQFVIRKTAHFTEFAVLGLLWAGVFLRRFLLKSFFLCTLTAVADEGIQLFVPGRSGQIRDILIDDLGTAVTLVLLWSMRFIWYRVSRRKMNQI